jgi:hypothetical protein
VWRSLGIDQGDPFGNALFSFVFKPVLEELRTAFPSVLSLAFADDLPMSGALTAVAAAAQHAVRPDGPLAAAGMRVNLGKTWVWSPTPLTAAERALYPVGINVATPNEGLIMWGTPIGSDVYVKKTLADTAASRILVTKSLRDLDTQTALLCARVGVNTRIDNLMRVVPPRLLDPEAASWDTKMRAYVATATGQTLTDDAAV